MDGPDLEDKIKNTEYVFQSLQTKDKGITEKLGDRPKKRRQRATFSCDRCKQRKRACKRYDTDGKETFDNKTACDQCKKAGSPCQTTISRKKRAAFMASESSSTQLKYLTKIFENIFPEFDVNNLKDIEYIAEALYLKLPKNNNEIQLSERCKNDNMHADVDYIDDNDLDKKQYSYQTIRGISSRFIENLSLKNDGIITRNDKILKQTRVASDCKKTNNLHDSQVGLGGAERIFTALLEIEKRRLIKDKKSCLDHSSSLNTLLKRQKLHKYQPNYLSGDKIQDFVLLKLIPIDECKIYTNYFFDKLHSSYFLFNEKKFRSRQDKLFILLSNEKCTSEDYLHENFCNEEICCIYFVWILGRLGYILRLKYDKQDIDPTLVSDLIVGYYINSINLCLSGCLFSNHLHAVQLLYLSSVYYGIIENKDASWHLMASCCIKCIELKFHRNSTIAHLPESEQEEIRITWWSCFKAHMNKCAILGRLPAISIYEVDLNLPNLNHIDDQLFKNTFLQSIELFKIMFVILRNREYIIKTRNVWCNHNLLQISDALVQWENKLDDDFKNYKRLEPKRCHIKVHRQYHYCVISFSVPYLILYALKPILSIKPQESFIKTICSGINSSVKLIEIICFSAENYHCVGLLYYDLFYAYNSLMILLLAYISIERKSNDETNKKHNVLEDILLETFRINTNTIIKAIMDIKYVNELYRSNATGLMKNVSDNIILLLKYFKLNHYNASTFFPLSIVNPASNEVPAISSLGDKLNISSLTMDKIEHMSNNPTIATPAVIDYDYLGYTDNDFSNIVNSMNIDGLITLDDWNDKLFVGWDDLVLPDDWLNQCSI